MSARSAQRLAAVVLVLAALLSNRPALAVDAAYTAAEAPDVVFSQHIQDKAAELGHDPVRIFEFVRNELAFEVYYGLMKGPEATLLSGGGNDYDLSALLVSLLRESGIPARFVRGKLRTTSANVRDWTGTIGPGAARAYFRGTQPKTWEPVPALAAEWSTPNFEVLHVWVEAYVPLGSYRGAGGNAETSSRGPAWIPLDPSFKLRAWNDDPLLPIGTSLSLDYGIDEDGGYYTSVQPQLPLEVFEDQVRAHLASSYDGSGAPQALEDVLFTGALREEKAGVLPTALPYELSPVLSAVRSATLVDLHRPPSAGGVWHASLPDAGLLGAPDYRYRRYIHLCKNNTADCETLSMSDSDKVLEASDWSAAWEGKRLTIWFPPTANSAPKLKEIGYASCTGTGGVTIKTLPTVSFGAGIHTQSTKEVNLCASLELVIELRDPPDRVASAGALAGQHFGVWYRADPSTTEPPGQYVPGSDLLPPYDFDMEAGEVYVASFDEYGASPTRVAEAATAVSTLIAFLPLAHDPVKDLAFIDTDRDGAKDENEEYLPHNPAAQEALTGSLLNLAHSWYWSEYRKRERRIASLHHLLLGHAPGRGRVTSGRDVEHLFDVPFELQPSNLLVDLAAVALLFTRGGQGVNLNPAGPPAARHGAELLAHEGSSLEHAVWEETVGAAAVSTVKGFQLGFELDESNPDVEIDLLAIDDATEAIALVQSRCGSNACNAGKGLDFATYCTIRQSFAIGSVGPSTWQSQCGGAFPGATTQLRILNRSNIDYHGYAGYVFARYTNSSLTMGIDLSNGGKVTDYVPTYDVPDPIYLPDVTSWIHEIRASLEITAGDPVSVTHGSYFENNVDVEIPGPAGMNLRVVRSYNSRLDYEGDLGHGWIHTFEQHLRIDPGEPDTGDEKVVWVTEQASEEPWDDEGSALTPEAWNRDELVRNPDESYVLTTYQGVVYRFHPAQSGRARLDTITDRHGNVIRCVYVSGQLRSVTDAAGRSLHFEYEFSYFRQPLDRIEDWTGRVWDYEVDESWDLIEYKDPEGHAWTYEYYSDDVNEELDHNLFRFERPAVRAGGTRYGMDFYYYPNDTVYRHVDALGRETRFSYNFFRRRTDVFQPDRGVETYFYDEYGNVTRFHTAEGKVTSYEFDAPRRLRTKEIDALGFETALGYDTDGNPLFRLSPGGKFDYWTHNEFGRPTFHTDGFINPGKETFWVYAPNGVDLIEQRAKLEGQDVPLWSYTYDSRGNRKTATEHVSATRSATTTFDYDPVSQYLVKVTSPDDSETRITPDAVGRAVRIERDRTVGPPGGQTNRPVVVTRSYDGLNRVVRQTDAGGVVREVDYDANGLPSEMRSIVEYGQSAPEIRVDQRNTYDAMDRLVSTVDALDRITTFGYDARDRRTLITTPLGKTIETVYDLDGRGIRSIDPTGAATATEYDPVGRPTRILDALGRSFETDFDEDGRILARREAGRTVFGNASYDRFGNLEEWTDARGLNVQTFDDLHRRVTLTTSGELTQFEYDYQGRLVRKLDGRSKPTTILYDDLGRVDTVTDALERPRNHFEYDEVGNAVGSTDGAGKQVRREYDAMGRITLEHDLSTDEKSEYRYDRRGRLVWGRGPDGAVETYAYDALDRLIERADAVGGVERFVYDADGQLRQHVQLPGSAGAGIVINYDYDSRGLLTAIRDPQAGVFQFEADAIGRPVRRTGPGGAEWRAQYTLEGDVDLVEIAIGSRTDTIDYGSYDTRGYPGSIITRQKIDATQTTVENLRLEYTPTGRLQRACRTNCDTLVLESYTYDAAGNRQTYVDQTGAGRTYHYDDANQLTQITAGLTGTGTVLESFEHDDAGRRTRRTAGSAVTDYGYDGLGRLVSLDRTGYSADLAYGASGRRTERVEGAVTSRYPTPRLEQRNGTDFRLLRGGGLGSVVAEVETLGAGGTRTHTLHRDASQNVGHVVRTEAGGSPTLETPPRRWTAFGAIRAGGPSLLERGYASQAAEGTSGLILMGARHYDPATGQFLQPDPLGVATNELYAYAANNPYVFWDPTGLAPMSFSHQAWGAVQDIGIGLGTAAASIVVPGFGEALDLYTVTDSDAPTWERTVAGASLTAGVYTAGLSPNASGVIHGARQIGEGFGQLATLGTRLLPEVASIARTAGDDLGRAFHHTFDDVVDSIRGTGLRPGSYATPTDGLSPLQAHIELALDPSRGARNSVLEIDVQGLRAAGYEIPAVNRVSGRFGMAGGGYEMQFPYAVPPEFIRVIQP
jgi:RHS repeat-associated protein